MNRGGTAAARGNPTTATAPTPPHSPVIALVGNPNSGKTTLFNALTGLRQKVGNYPGVTVERKEGTVLLPESASVTPAAGESIARAGAALLMAFPAGQGPEDAGLPQGTRFHPVGSHAAPFLHPTNRDPQ